MLRKATSLTLCLSFIILCVSSVLLFIAPEGRVAYWSNWTSLSLSKAQWGDIHITGDFLFLGACVLHACINIRPMIAYLKIRSGKTALPVLIAMLPCALVYVGTLAEWRPLSDVIVLNDSIILFAAFDMAHAGAAYTATIETLLCSPQQCIPAKVSFKGALPADATPVAQMPWFAQWQEHTQAVHAVFPPPVMTRPG